MRIQTRLTSLLGIEHPLIQAAMGTASSAELAAAASNAGALGSIGSLFRPLADLRRQLERMPDLTQRPWAVNHVVPVLDLPEVALPIHDERAKPLPPPAHGDKR